MDWRHVRHVVLSVNPSLYGDGEEAYDDVTHQRGIGNLVKNLERTDGINIVDWVTFVEWYKNGFPHWHIFLETEEEGKAGMIGHGNIKRRWPFGIYVNEDFVKSEGHWNNLTGYFNSHGYFEKGKGYQGKLPAWAMKSDRRIKRWFGMKEGSRREKQNVRIRLNETSGNDEGFSIDPKKCAKCNSKRMCESLSDGRGCRDVNESTIRETVSYLAKRKTYEMKLSECGAKSRIEIWGPSVYEEDQKHDVFVCKAPYEVLRKIFPWEYVEGEGLVMKLDDQGFRRFVEILCFLGEGECYQVRGAEANSRAGEWARPPAGLPP